MKQRKMMVRYILFQTKGEIFDKLVNYIHYHSLSDLLVELMQIKIPNDEKKEGPDGTEVKKSSLQDDDDDDGDSEDSSSKSLKGEVLDENSEMSRILSKKKSIVVR